VTYFYPPQRLEEGEEERGRENAAQAGRSNEPRDISVQTRLYLRGGRSRRTRKRERERERDAVHHRRMKNLAFPDEKRYL